MAKRRDFHALLEAITPNVYFQPPTNTDIKYPCIIYERSSVLTEHADNFPYGIRKRYMVTIIDKKPDSPIFDAVAQLQTSEFDRFFTVDNLNHDVFNVYF